MEYTINEISIEICDRLGIPRKGKTTGNIVVKCLSPNHVDKNPSCSVSLDKGLWHCFSCGNGGSLTSLYYERTGHGIRRDLGITTTYNLYKTIEEETPDFNQLPDTDFKLNGQFFPIDSTDLSKNWISKRGFDVDTLNKLSIKYLKFGRTFKASDPLEKSNWRNFSEMAIIPIYEQGKLICFEARQLRSEDEWRKYLQNKNIDDSEKIYKKVLYPKGGSTKTLYRLEYLDTNKPLYLVEGLMDLLSLKTNQYFDNSTTTFGRSIKERQFYLLSKFKEIVLIPNLDIPGLSAIQQFKDKNMTNVKVLFLPFKNNLKDVNDILQKKCQRFNSLQDLIDMNWLDSIQDLRDVNIEQRISCL